MNMLPNPSLNAEVSRAGLRPRSGPPVHLFRWASLAGAPTTNGRQNSVFG